MPKESEWYKAKIASHLLWVVEFRDLDFRFDFGKPTVLRNINLSVPAGTLLGL